MVDLPSGPLAEVDLEFQKMALETAGLTFALAGTGVREKLLQVTAHDICRGHLGLAFSMHVTALHAHGVPYADVLALIRFVAPYAGYPAAADALGRLAEVAAGLGLDTTPEPSRVAAGTSAPGWPAGDPWLAGFLASRTGRAWSEERLSARERAFVTLTAHVARRAFGESFRRHVALALRTAGADEVRDAVRFTAELGVIDAADAMEALEQALTAA
ncbi:dehydrogenase [Nonomuraea sp. MG754425]|uniref:hypothetical protein n=1 Tax=Nonomuraea sp. MG754425 TaxID=2570319 RepID=UPI001F279FB4|nr:hypothetical protein [Nonomuraea sp. MG754425]MCF6468697.1 dehydrogenase [Nonomuraea sp. MG754425]